MTMTPAAVQSMLSQLRTRGFACVSLLNNNNPKNNSILNQSGRSNKNDNWIYDALRCATRRDAASMNEFRFPPTTEGRPIVYSHSKREAFRALFEVATTCFEGLLTMSAAAAADAAADVTATSKRNGGVEDNSSAQQQHHDDGGAIESRRMFAKALHRVRDRKAHQLFHGDENEPFQQQQQQQSGQHPFSQSFFNLFNYDHGSLNGHVDRSLLTVIYSCSYGSTMPELANGEDDEGGTMHRSSALWVKDSFGKWRNADRMVEPHQAIVMVGEDLERSGIAEELGLFAAEHAVRVDPEGERIAHSHFRRDPACSDNCGGGGGIEGSEGGVGVGNRLSAAMILRHEPE